MEPQAYCSSAPSTPERSSKSRESKSRSSSHSAPDRHASSSSSASSSSASSNSTSSSTSSLSKLQLSPQKQKKLQRSVAAQKAAVKFLDREQRLKNKVDIGRDLRITQDTQTWSSSILPHWTDSMRSSSVVASLCARGIPPKVRTEAWKVLLGNSLMITEELFRIHSSKASHMLDDHEEKAARGSSTDGEKTRPRDSSASVNRESTIKDIDIDIPRTFPKLEFFHDGGEWENRLRMVLAAYCSYRPDFGYTQGMSFLAGMLLLHLETCDAFIGLANLLNSARYFSSGYRPDLLEAEADRFNEAFKANLPLLWKHFSENEVTHELYLVDWRLSMFARLLPLDVCVRVWDNFLRVGEDYFFKCALGVLKLLGKTLAMAGNDLGGILKVLRKDGGMEGVDVEELFESVGKIKLESRGRGLSGIGIGSGWGGKEICKMS